MARPPLDLDEKIIYAMAERGWSDDSIAAAFRCSPKTITNRFSTELAQCRLAGKNKMLDLMYEMAFKKGDVQAAKYLCDRVLGPIERKTIVSVQDAQRVIEIDLQSRGIEISSALERLTTGEPDNTDPV
jgi:hypothetical protein